MFHIIQKLYVSGRYSLMSSKNIALHYINIIEVCCRTSRNYLLSNLIFWKLRTKINDNSISNVQLRGICMCIVIVIGGFCSKPCFAHF